MFSSVLGVLGVLAGLIVCAGMFLFPALTPAQARTGSASSKVQPTRGDIRPLIPQNSSDPLADAMDRSIELGDRGSTSRMHKEVREKLKITDEEKANYKKALNDSKANIVRLLSAFSCSTSLVIDMSDSRCSENPYYFEGSYYSFRYKDYGESPWMDLNLIEDEFTAGNKWNTVGFLVDLGDGADFSKLDENSKEIKALWQLPSAETLEEKTEQRTKLEKGFTYNEVFVTNKTKLQANHTYLLRTIAYRVEGGFAMFKSAFNWYNTDSLFVFKVAAFDDQRIATIGWKKMMQRVAPMLRDKEKEKTP